MSLLVVDIGSSSVRALLFDNNAIRIPSAISRRHHQMSAYGSFEITALQERIESCIDDVLHHPAASEITAVGMTSFVGNVLGVDINGAALTPLLTYTETRATPELEELRPHYESLDSLQRTGCPHHTAYQPSQLLWFQRHYPEIASQVVQWQDLGSFLYRQFFGRPIPMSYSCASWSGLLNRKELVWDKFWLEKIDGLSIEKLPPLADFDATQQGLTPIYQQRWPQLANTPFFLTIGDGAVANIGSGAINEKAVALTIGTTAALRMIIPSSTPPPVPEGLWAYRVDTKRHLIGGATTEGGNLYEWLSQTLCLPPDAEKQLAMRDWGEHGLEIIPSFAGERSPGYNPYARGEIRGLRLSTSPLDILQATLESVVERLKLIFDRLPIGADTNIYASGGALRNSSIWGQMIAHHFQRKIYVVASHDASARGMACLILSQMTNRHLEDFAPQFSNSYSP